MRNCERSIWSLVGLVTVACMLLSACAPAATPTVPEETVAPSPTPPPPSPTPPPPTPTAEVGPKLGGTLIYGHVSDFIYWHPGRLPYQDWPMFNQIFNVLVRYDSNLEPQPELAESWEFSEDSLALTLHLRQGVKFHTGREFAADDVKFTVENYQDEETLANIRPLAMGIESVEVVDDYTAVLHFAKPFPAVFDVLDLLYIVDKETIDEIDEHPVGTGPFELAEWIGGDHAKFVRFDDYWKEGLPYLDEVMVKAAADGTAMTLDLEGGGLDIAEVIPYEAFERLEANPEIEVVRGVEGNIVYEIIANVTREPFDNKKVRQAMQYALDRQGLADTAFLRIPDPWVEPVPEQSLAYDPALADYYTFDLDKAKELLSEAGYPDGFEVEFIAAGWSPEHLAITEVFQADLAKIGVKLNVRSVEPAEYSELIVVEGDYTIANHAYGRAQKDPASLWGTAKAWTVDFNLSRFYDDEYARLVEEGASEPDPEKRKETYHELVKMCLDESFVLVLFPRIDAWGVQSYVKGLDWNQDNMPIFEKVWLDR